MLRRLKNYYHLLQSIVGKVRYNVDTEGMTFIGITGTDGKTTTSNLLYHILTTAGYKSALISTISAKIGSKTLDTGFHVTTPSPMALQSYIKQAKKTGAKYIILEVTSHALDQYRVFGIPFTIGILTNITREHLNYHKTYENYVATKMKLLLKSKEAIINCDDGSYPLVQEHLQRARFSGHITTYCLHGEGNVTFDTFPFHTSLVGEFNKYNILAASSAAKLLGVPDADIVKAIASFTPPTGRTEIVHEGDFTVMIDFAHTSNSIKQLLSSIQHELRPTGKIIHVFGSAGERDREKREEMGENAAEFADSIILTAEDPRSEAVSDINAQILQGIHKQKKKIEIKEIPDRKEAIKYAIHQAEKGDIVVITGKGHERSMNLGEGEIPWSDHEAVQEALQWRNV